MIYAKLDLSVGVVVMPKCGTSTFNSAAIAGRLARPERLEDVPKWFAISRHPMGRLESFVKDKGMIQPLHGDVSQDCQKNLWGFLSRKGQDRLLDGALTIRDLVSAICYGYMDPHINPLSPDIPEHATVLRFEDVDGTFETLSRELGAHLIQENSTEHIWLTPQWDDDLVDEVFDRYHEDFLRFDYRPYRVHATLRKGS